jgi:hypothetical protein
MRRHFSIFLAAFFALAAIATLPAHAQKVLRNSDVAVSAFGQFTSDVTGDGITLTTSRSLGGQAAFRHSYHWWLGYEAAYSYTRFSEFYSGQAFPLQHNVHDFSGAYLVQGPRAFGFQPFASVGISALVFSPSLNGGQRASWQPRAGLNYSVGVNKALFTSHFGVRVQYRGVYYKAPDFGEAALTTNSHRLTSEPMAGVYLRF